jgi:hypothetical protein
MMRIGSAHLLMAPAPQEFRSWPVGGAVPPDRE